MKLFFINVQSEIIRDDEFVTDLSDSVPECSFFDQIEFCEIFPHIDFFKARVLSQILQSDSLQLVPRQIGTAVF